MLISGTPSAAGTFNFTPRVTDSLSLTDTSHRSVDHDCESPCTKHYDDSTPRWNGGNSPIVSNSQATGGTGTRVGASISGSLPSNLSLAPTTGVISGTPTSTSASNFTVQVTDGLSLSDTQALSITISAVRSSLTITTDRLPEGRRNLPYTDTLEASGGTIPYTWSVTPALPAGLTLDPASGMISGTPRRTSNINHDFTVRDSSDQTTTKKLRLRIRNSNDDDDDDDDDDD